MAGEDASDPLSEFLAEIRAAGEHAPDSTLLLYKPESEDRTFYIRLCETYRQSDDRQKSQILDAVRASHGLLNHLLGFIYLAAENLIESKDARWLQLGVTAAVIQGSRLDFRDYLSALAELFVTAEEQGIDPVSLFAAAGGEVPADFGRYAVVAARHRRNT